MGTTTSFGAELKELGLYPEGDGESLKDSKRGNGAILSHPGKEAFLILSAASPHHVPARAP